MKKVYPHDQKHNRWPQTLKKIGFVAFFAKPHPRFSKQKIGAAGVPVAPTYMGRPQMGRAAAIMVVANGYSVAPTLTISTLKIKVEYGGMLPVPFLP